MEPFLPDQYFVSTNVRMVVDGQHVRATVKKWFDEDTQSFKEKIVAFEPDSSYVQEDHSA